MEDAPVARAQMRHSRPGVHGEPNRILITAGLRAMPRPRRAGHVAAIGFVAQLLGLRRRAAGDVRSHRAEQRRAGTPGARPARRLRTRGLLAARQRPDHVRTGPQSLALLKDTQWTEPLPHLVQSRLIQTFENGHLLRSVGYPGQGIAGNLVLDSEIRRFEVNTVTGEATVEISGKLINAGSGRILAAQIFSAQAPGSAADGASASAASMSPSAG